MTTTTGTDSIAMIAMSKSGETSAIPNSKPQNMEMYNIFYTTSRMNATLHAGDADAPAQYYFQTKLTTIRKPQLYLRKGAAKTSPTIGVVKIQWTSRHLLIARGDYEHNQGEATWEQLSREMNAFRCSDYHMSTNDIDGLNLQWRKDRSRTLATVYDCVDENGSIVALLRSGGAFNWKKGGELQISNSANEAMKEWLLLSGMGIWVWEALDYQSILQGFDSNPKEKVQ